MSELLNNGLCACCAFLGLASVSHCLSLITSLSSFHFLFFPGLEAQDQAADVGSGADSVPVSMANAFFSLFFLLSSTIIGLLGLLRVSVEQAFLDRGVLSLHHAIRSVVYTALPLE